MRRVPPFTSSLILGLFANDTLFCSELAVYHSEHAGSSDAGYATFIVGGAPRVSYLDSVRDTDKMAIDDEEMDEESEDVPETKITLVREADLESARDFSFASRKYYNPNIRSLKGAVLAHTLRSYLQPFAFTYPCKHHPHPAFVLCNCI